MQLDRMMERCRQLEERAAALYRTFAAAARTQPTLCALWTQLAREEEGHARMLAGARGRLEATTAWRTQLDGWDEALGEVEARLRDAERLGPLASTDRQLCAALALEATELDAARHVLLELARQPDHEVFGEHALHLADAAARLSEDPDVQLQAALVRAGARMRAAS